MKTYRCFAGASAICFSFTLATAIGFGQQSSISSYTLNIPPDVSSIANHLRHAGNTLREVLPNVPDGTLLYKFDADRQILTVNQFQAGAWLRPNETLAPGEGALIRNPGDAFTIAFSGISPGNVRTPDLAPGFNLISLPAPGESQFMDPIGGDTIWEFDSRVQGYRPHTFDDLDNNWIPPVGGLFSDPGYSFFYDRRGAGGPNLTPGATVYFSTYVPGTVNARITWDDGIGSGQGFTAQLYGGPAGTAIEELVPLFPVTTFQTTPAALGGYVDPVVVTMPGLPYNNTPVTIVMRVFDGDTFESSALRGETSPVTLRAGGLFYPPGNLEGMLGFSFPRPAGGITFERTASGLTLTYNGTLQSANVVTGPYADFPGASSPMTVPFREAAQFYRVNP